jgi:hypothetical protein
MFKRLIVVLLAVFMFVPSAYAVDNMCDYLEDELIDHVFKTGAFTVPTNIYIALCNSTPTDVCTCAEVTGGSYAREAVNTWDVSLNGATENTNAIIYTTATTDWEVIIGWIAFDAITSGNSLLWGVFDAPITKDSGTTVEIDAGDIDASFE